MRVVDTYIDRELWRHKDAYKDARALVIGEDRWSGEFVRSLLKIFHKVGFKKLSCITTSEQQMDLFSDTQKSLFSTYNGVSWSDTEVSTFGGFGSEFVQSILKDYDIVFGMPTLEEIDSYVTVLDRKGKTFVLLSHLLSVFKEGVFKLFKSDRIHFGFTLKGEYIGVKEDFDGELDTLKKWNRVDGSTMRLQNMRWYCNTNSRKYCHRFSFYHIDTKDTFEKFDNFDALNVPDYRNIPLDYKGLIGTSPIFLDVMRRDEFDLVCKYTDLDEALKLHGKFCQYRIFVKRR